MSYSDVSPRFDLIDTTSLVLKGQLDQNELKVWHVETNFFLYVLSSSFNLIQLSEIICHFVRK